MKPQLWLILILQLCLSPRVHAQGAVVLSENNQRLMAISLTDGTGISEALPIYAYGASWYLPLSEFARGLGLAIDPNLKLRTASGFIIEEQNIFALDLAKCSFSLKGIAETFDCREAMLFEDDIYVSDALLTRLLPVRLKVDSYRSEVEVEPLRTLPLQERLKRERNNNARNAQTSKFDPGYPRVDVPRKAINFAFLDAQVGLLTERAEQSRREQTRHDLVAAGELLGMEASLFTSGYDSEVEKVHATLARRDAEGKLLGPLKATDVQLLDVTVPSLALIGNAGLYRGALIGNYPLHAPAQFGTHDFLGNLAAGWEVELYQNDILVDRRLSVDGRYEFRAVPLTYGINRFKLAYYGPQGQRRESFETFSIDNSLIQPGTGSYRIAATDDPRGDSRVVMQYDQSVLKNLTLISGYSHLTFKKDGEPEDFAVLGARLFASNILLQSTAAMSAEGGYVFENGVQTPFGDATAGLKHTRLFDFESEVFTEKRGFLPREIFGLNFTLNLFSKPTVRLTFEGTQTEYEDGNYNGAFLQRTSTKLGPIYWFNNLIYDEHGGGTSGDVSALAIIKGTEVRAQGTYDADHFTGSMLDVQKPITDRMTATVGWAHYFDNDLHRFTAALNRRFKKLTLSLNSSLENNGTFAAGALLSFSLGLEPHTSSINLDGRARATTGSASVLVFFDKNQNGKRDEGEPPIANARPTINQQEIDESTNSQGIVLLSGLEPWTETDISISLRSIEDPSHRPSPDGVRFAPRPGTIARLEIPVIAVSELTGFVRIVDEGSERGKRAIDLELIDLTGAVVATARTESDGYYLMDRLKIGQYQLRISPEQRKTLGLRSEPEYFDIQVKADELFDGVRDFKIYPTQP